MRRTACIALCVLTISITACAADPVVVQRDIVYGTGGGSPLKLDFAKPAQGKGPFPLVVCYHGGGWQHGNKAHLGWLLNHLGRNGFAVASVGYRLAPEAKFPAQIEDAKCAVRFLRANAAKFDIDPDRIGAYGESAGGQIALLVGLAGKADGLEGSGGWAETSSAVSAVLNVFGPTDFVHWKFDDIGEGMIKIAFKKSSDGVFIDYLGTADRKSPVMVKASPVTYIDRADPPVMTFHGTLDKLVEYPQAELLHAALRKAGVPETLVTLQDAIHGWGGEKKQRTDRELVAFFTKHLKGERSPKPTP